MSLQPDKFNIRSHPAKCLPAIKYDLIMEAIRNRATRCTAVTQEEVVVEAVNTITNNSREAMVDLHTYISNKLHNGLLEDLLKLEINIKWDKKWVHLVVSHRTLNNSSSKCLLDQVASQTTRLSNANSICKVSCGRNYVASLLKCFITFK